MDTQDDTAASQKVRQLQQQQQKLQYEHIQLQKKLKTMQRRRWILFVLMVISGVLLFSYQHQVIETLQRWDNYQQQRNQDDESDDKTTETNTDGQADKDTDAEDETESTTMFVVKEKEITDWLRLKGKVNPIELLEISSPMETTVKKIHFRYGESVTKGQLLLELDTDRHKSLLRDAEAKHIQAKKAFKRLKNWSQSREMSQARRRLEKAQTQLRFAQKKKAHTQTLYEKGIISRSELENEEQQLQSLEDTVLDARQSLQKTKAEGSAEMVRITELTLANAKQHLKNIKQSLSRAKLYSPKNGIIFSPISTDDPEKETAGQLYNGRGVKKNSTLFVVASLEGIMIETKATEKQLLKLKRDMDVAVSLNIIKDIEIKGKVTYIADRAESDTDGDGGAQFKVRVEVRELSAEQHDVLKVGMTANIKLKSYHNPKAIVVPFKVLQVDDSKQYSVTIVKATGKNTKDITALSDEALEERDIQIRQTLANGVEVTEGLKAGDVLLIQEGQK